ncbi:MAG TPA: HEAT repeat domain-containing protein [Armatimonadota bacterium]|jgi:HEAT repeat protein|nr:HEAT repeat domain-containing protein [Armatimonadota bacterium]
MVYNGATVSSDSSFGFPAALLDSCWRTRRQAVEELANAGNRGTPILGEALGDRCASVRLSVVEALKSHANRRAVNALLAALADRKPSVRRAAAEALSGRDTPRVVKALVGLLRDSIPKVREAALGSLSISADKRAVTAIANAFADPDEDVRLAAAMALSNMGQRALPGATHVLHGTRSTSRAMDDPHRIWARMTAILLLKGIADDEAVIELIKTLQDDDATVRRAAIIVLTDMECQQAIPGLIRACSDDDDSVRAAADAGLKALCGEDPAADGPQDEPEDEALPREASERS